MGLTKVFVAVYRQSVRLLLNCPTCDQGEEHSDMHWEVMFWELLSVYSSLVHLGGVWEWKAAVTR